MADKRIDQLTAATTMGDDDLLVLQQNNQAKKLSGATLSDYIYDVVEVSNTQPAESRNKVWIKPSSEDLVLAEQSDVDELKTAITDANTNIYKSSTCSNNSALSSSNGSVSSNQNYWITDYVSCDGGTHIVSNYPIYKACYYNSSKTFISAEPSETYCKTVPSTAKYARLQFAKATVSFASNDLVLILTGKELMMKNHALNVDNVEITDYLVENAVNIYNKFGVFEYGTYDASTGDLKYQINRLRLARAIPISDFVLFEITENALVVVCAWDKNNNFLGNISFFGGTQDLAITPSFVLSIIPNAYYIKFVIRNVENSAFDITELGTYIKGLYVLPSAYTYQFDGGEQQVDVTYGEVTYTGERIVLKPRLNYSYSRYNVGCAGQDGAIYNNFAFMFSDSGLCKIYDVNDISAHQITSFTPTGLSSLEPHCNSVCFGSYKYDSDDTYPVIYCNAYNNTSLPKGTLYAIRLSETDNVPSGGELIQTISIGFTDNSIWTDGNDVRPYGNFIIDTDNNYLYAYTIKDADNVTRFFKFNLPLPTAGNVTLATSDIIEYFDVPYMPYIQGVTYYNGNVYSLNGLTEETAYLQVINLISKRIQTIIKLSDISEYEGEPEWIDIIDNHIVFGTTNSYRSIVLYT